MPTHDQAPSKPITKRTAATRGAYRGNVETSKRRNVETAQRRNADDGARQGLSPRFIAWGWAIVPALVLLTGCATAPAPTRIDPFPIAVRFALPSRATADLDEPFRRCARLGFDHAVIPRTTKQETTPLIAAAARADLRVLLSDRSLDFYLHTGLGSVRGGSITAFFDELHKEAGVHPVATGMVVTPGRDARAGERMERVATCAAARGFRVFPLPDGTAESFAAPCLVVLSPEPGKSDAGRSQTEHMLHDLHAGLLAGRTGGVVVDLNAELDPATTGAVQATVTRARAWGKFLCGATLLPRMSPSDAKGDADFAVFAAGSRRYLLVSNPSMERYLRSTVRVPENLTDRAIIRAVEVPVSPGGLPGKVHAAPAGQLQVPVDLRPGDAALFELF